jgi:hypothetical protein
VWLDLKAVVSEKCIFIVQKVKEHSLHILQNSLKVTAPNARSQL